MHRKSSRRSGNQKDSKRRESKKRRDSSCSRPPTSHPATGFYSDYTDPSATSYTYSNSSRSYSKKRVIGDDGRAVETESYSSTDEYQVDFPEVQVKMPRCRRHRHRSESHGPVDRNAVYDELVTESLHSHHSHGSHLSHSPYSCSTDSTNYETYNSQQRFQSIGNIFTSMFGFFQNNPNMTKVLLGILLCYVVVCNLEILIPKIISMIVRLLYPWARYWTVVAEQFASAIANMFTRMDAVIYASYCEFAAKYCRNRRLMCDVTCSFVDHVLSQSRPHLAPVPQN